MLTSQKIRLAFLMLLAVSCAACAPRTAPNGDPNAQNTAENNAASIAGLDPEAFKIVVAVPPLRFLAQRLAGSHAQVVSLLNEYDDYRAKPGGDLAATFAGAKLFLQTGAAWEKQLPVPAGCQVVNVVSEIKMKTIAAHTEYVFGAKNNALDPYVWLAPSNNKEILPKIYAALRTLDPTNYEDYSQNYTRLQREINATEGDIQRILLSRLSTDIFVMPPVLGYFCDDFGLKQHTYDTSAEHGETDFVRLAIERKIRVVLLSGGARLNEPRVAEWLNGHVDTVNPLADDYLNNLLRLASAIAGRDFTPLR